MSVAARHRLQKLEFLVCWVMIFIATLQPLVLYSSSSGEDTMILTHDKQMVSASVYTARVAFQLSVFTRAIAYIVDFSNAWIKLDGTVPLWLVLHHGGGLVRHFQMAFFLPPSTYQHVRVYAFSSQSSHNTWTKKYSKVLYWGNVALGVLNMCYHYFLMVPKDTPVSQWLSYSNITILIGVMLLVLESFVQKFPSMGLRVITNEKKK